jgi:hypothetical protein
MNYSDTDGTIHKRSGWLIPLAVFLITFAFSALFLLFYLAPSAPNFQSEQVAPTARTDKVALRVHGLHLWIPANYLEHESARSGGARADIALFTVLPALVGWSPVDAPLFSGNAPDSPVVYLLIRNEAVNLSEADRLSRIYIAYVGNPRGQPGPFGLTQFAFRENSGYGREDLFVGQSGSGPVVLRCVRFSPEVPSPSCLRDLPVAHGVALSYRFKRAHLAKWREIASGIDSLIARFEKAPAAVDQPKP